MKLYQISNKIKHWYRYRRKAERWEKEENVHWKKQPNKQLPWEHYKTMKTGKTQHETLSFFGVKFWDLSRPLYHFDILMFAIVFTRCAVWHGDTFVFTVPIICTDEPTLPDKIILHTMTQYFSSLAFFLTHFGFSPPPTVRLTNRLLSHPMKLSLPSPIKWIPSQSLSLLIKWA